MEAEVIVERVEGRYAVIALTGEAIGCGRCDHRGCGRAVLSTPSHRAVGAWRVENDIAAKAGERLVVRFAAASVCRIAIAVCLIPAALTIGGAALAGWMIGSDADAAAAVGAAAGFALALAAGAVVRRRPSFVRVCRPILVRVRDA